MAEQPGAGRLDPETLAAYVDGLLPPEERARVEAAIAADPETYEWVVNVVNAVEDVSNSAPVDVRSPADRVSPGDDTRGGGTSAPTVLPFTRRRAVAGLAGTLLAAAAALLIVVRTQPVWWQSAWGPSVDPRFAKLVEAVGEERYIEARLTGGFKYGPLREVMRGPGDLANQNLRLLAAAGELQKAAERDARAEDLHAWGVAQIMLGQPKSAIETIGRIDIATASAEALADLAAAHLAAARDDRDAIHLRRALDAARTALERSPTLAPALFNQALALDLMGMAAEAGHAWIQYLRVEKHDPWRREAQQRLEARQRPAEAR